MPDVLIAGGGVIGLSTAWELARQGVSVVVLEQGQLGQEASWAGAGMLPPGNPEFASPGEPSLRALSCRHWPDWVERLRTATGIDNGYRNSGRLGLFRGGDGDSESELSTWRDEQIVAHQLSQVELRNVEAEVGESFFEAIRVPEFCQVRNPRHLKALSAACLNAGVEFREGTPVTGWDVEQDRVVAAKTSSGSVHAGQFVVATGAWSKPLLDAAGCPIPIEPVRGQIALLKTRPRLFEHVLEVGSRYLVPRGDGRVVVGSTEERVGFRKQNTTQGVQGLLEFAIEVVPALADAELERCWAGLRPGIRNGLPVIGRIPQMENLFVAAGHFRSGLQNSPGTGILMRELILGQTASIDPEPFSVAARVERSSTISAG
jgi:glycine oxidase